MLAILAAGVIPSAAAGLTSSSASAATVLPSAQVAPNAVAIGAGTSAQLSVKFASAKPTNLRWTLEGRPDGVSARFECSTSRSCVVTLSASAAAQESTALLELVLRAGSSSRRIPVALHVEPVPPAPATTTTTTPPVTTTTIGRTLALRPNFLIATTIPGLRVVFPISLIRNGWSDPVDLSVESLPNDWRSAYVPTPAGASTQLILDSPANTPVGDYPIRLIGRSGSVGGETLVIVRVRAPELSLNLLSVPTNVAPGTTARFLLDVRSVDDVTRPVTVRLDGLFPTLTYVVTPNPGIGTVAVDVAVPATSAAVTYLFFFVASRDGVEVKIPGSLAVAPLVPNVASSFRFVPTPVAPVAGDSRGYGLSSPSNAITVARGANVTFDVQVVPKGGFADAIDLAFSTPTGWSVTWLVVGVNTIRVSLGAPTTAPVGATSLVLSSSSGNLSASITYIATVT